MFSAATAQHENYLSLFSETEGEKNPLHLCLPPLLQPREGKKFAPPRISGFQTSYLTFFKSLSVSYAETTGCLIYFPKGNQVKKTFSHPAYGRHSRIMGKVQHSHRAATDKNAELWHHHLDPYYLGIALPIILITISRNQDPAWSKCSRA